MTLIESWLAGSRNFINGRILYKQFGSDEELKQLFAAGETKESKAKMADALQAIAAAPVAQAVNSIGNTSPFTETQFAAAVTKFGQDHASSKDAVEEAIERDWKTHYTHMNQLRGRLDAYGTDNSPQTIAACHQLCIDILEEEQYINACWEKLDFYRVHKRLPETEEPIVIPKDPIQLANFIVSTKKNISRNKLKALRNPNNAKYPALIAMYEAVLKQIHEQKTD